GPVLKKDYPEVEEVSRYTTYRFAFDIDNGPVVIEGAFADSSFFSLFDLPFVSGSREEALHNSNGIVLTQSLAARLFGVQEALGQTVRLDQEDRFIVVAVIDDLPDNSHFKGVEYFLPWSYMESKDLGGPHGSWTHNP